MRKEALIAIILGVVLGIGGAAFLIIKTTFQRNQNLKLPQAQDSGRNVVGAQKDIVTLEVTTPQDGAIVTAPTIIVKGKAQKNTLIIIQTQIKETIAANQNGVFTATVPLALGENTLMVTAYPKDAKIPPQYIPLKVYYLDEE